MCQATPWRSIVTKDVEKHLHLLICFFSRCRVENENHRWYRKGEENNMDLSNEFKETGV